MIAVLDIRGWRKEIQVTESVLRCGAIEVDIDSPFDLAISPGEFLEYATDAELRTVRAKINGRLSKRTISPEAQAKMQAGRKKKKIKNCTTCNEKCTFDGESCNYHDPQN